MFLTGFADEASPLPEVQIAVTKKLGWSHIESRMVWDTRLGMMTDAQFETFQGLLNDAGITLSCYGSSVADWSRHPRKQEDFEASRKELLTAIPRMKKLGCNMIRGMSFLRPNDEAPDSPELEAIIFAKMRELLKICEDNGVIYAHENCMNYGGLSHLHTLKLLDAVKSPALKLVFDTGNPCFNLRRIGTPPYAIQSSWEFYRNVREFIVYVHVKDGTANLNAKGEIENTVFTFAGFGNGDLRAIVSDLRQRGYDGGFSIEPHLGCVFHETNANASTEELDRMKQDVYVKYGRNFMNLLRDCGYEC